MVNFKTVLVSSVDAELHFVDGIVDDADGTGAVTAFVLFGNFQLMARITETFQRIVHVGLVGRMGVLDENTAGDQDSEGEGKEEMSEVEFHGWIIKRESLEARFSPLPFKDNRPLVAD